jgi:hypothetical protein
LQGVYDPTSEFLVCKLLQGMKRLRHTADSRLPITKTILAGILRVLPCICRNDYECALFSAVFSLAFHGLFRVGELVSHRTSPTRVLQRGDVQLDRANGSLNINIVYSKTDQLGNGTLLNIAGTGDSTCPFNHLQVFLKARPESSGPLFCHFDSSPLTRYQFSAILAKAIKLLKLPGKYKAHSFRIGASTELAIRGFPSDVIQKSGRWQSNCYKSYIRIPKF